MVQGKKKLRNVVLSAAGVYLAIMYAKKHDIRPDKAIDLITDWINIGHEEDSETAS